MEAHKQTLDQVVDLSTYTGMEVEHGHDTQSELNLRRGVHVPVDAINETTNKAHRQNGQVRDSALAHTLSSVLKSKLWSSNVI